MTLLEFLLTVCGEQNISNITINNNIVPCEEISLRALNARLFSGEKSCGKKSRNAGALYPSLSRASKPPPQHIAPLPSPQPLSHPL